VVRAGASQQGAVQVRAPAGSGDEGHLVNRQASGWPADSDFCRARCSSGEALARGTWYLHAIGGKLDEHCPRPREQVACWLVGLMVGVGSCGCFVAAVRALPAFCACTGASVVCCGRLPAEFCCLLN
jgi:hypothetical protein